MSCPLCTIPQREKPIYEDEYIFLVPTKDLKGHKMRVMVCIREHRKEPTFVERTRAYAITMFYMDMVMKGESWLFVEDTYASIPNHWHLITSCENGTPEELNALRRTPTVKMPLDITVCNDEIRSIAK